MSGAVRDTVMPVAVVQWWAILPASLGIHSRETQTHGSLFDFWPLGTIHAICVVSTSALNHNDLYTGTSQKLYVKSRYRSA